MRKEAINNHLEKFPQDFDKLANKCYYILKTLAHYRTNLNVANPYQDNNGDIFFCFVLNQKKAYTADN